MSLGWRVSNHMEGTTMMTTSTKMGGNGRLYAEAAVGPALVRLFLRDEGVARWTIDTVEGVDWDDVTEAVAACARRLAGEDIEFIVGPDVDADVNGDRWIRLSGSQIDTA